MAFESSNIEINHRGHTYTLREIIDYINGGEFSSLADEVDRIADGKIKCLQDEINELQQKIKTLEEKRAHPTEEEPPHDPRTIANHRSPTLAESIMRERTEATQYRKHTLVDLADAFEQKIKEGSDGSV